MSCDVNFLYVRGSRYVIFLEITIDYVCFHPPTFPFFLIGFQKVIKFQCIKFVQLYIFELVRQCNKTIEKSHLKPTWILVYVVISHVNLYMKYRLFFSSLSHHKSYLYTFLVLTVILQMSIGKNQLCSYVESCKIP